MTSREIVKMSLEFAGPPRIPYGMGGGFPRDMASVGRKGAPNSRAKSWKQYDGYWEMIDEWGNIWRRLESITKGEVYKGVIEDSWDMLYAYEFPKTDGADLYEGARARCQELHEEGFFVLGSVGWPFNIARYMRRMENFLADVAGEKELVKDLLKRIADILEVEIYRMADAGVDGIMSGEDWGTQDRLLVHPNSFREIFKPCFEQLCGAAHSRGLSVWFHSCGHVTEVLEDWVEAGIDVCQFDQPELHGIDYLSENFGGRMHFWSPVDIQKTLQTGEPATVEAAAKEYIDKLGSFGGGFVAGYYGSNEAIGVDPALQAVACEAFMKYGDPAPKQSGR
ncbi:uroporphyrinogen decarboxylase family protein [Candidatus Poribacteria bacterium]